jgi:hypothetical protein
MRNPRYASGLVFGNPITLSPGLKSPRFLSNSTRSNRFSTFRFATIVLAPFKLRCCDINFPQVNGDYNGPTGKINPPWKSHPAAAHRDLQGKSPEFRRVQKRAPAKAPVLFYGDRISILTPDS